MAYKWDTPLEWLQDHLDTLPPEKVLFEAKALASKLDFDTIQDEYQAEMDDDGYFDGYLVDDGCLDEEPGGTARVKGESS